MLITIQEPRYTMNKIDKDYPSKASSLVGKENSTKTAKKINYDIMRAVSRVV